MPPRVEVPDLDDLIRRYKAGTSILQLSKESGISRPVLTSRFREAGIQPRGQSEAQHLKWERIRDDPALVKRQLGAAWDAARKLPAPPSGALTALRDAYASGSLRSTCHANGWSVWCACEQLTAAGVVLRSRSEATRHRWVQIKAEGRIEEQMAAAHAAARGRVKPAEERERIAATRQVRRSRRGRWEDELTDMLTERGSWTVIQQRAMGPYNIDIALEEPRVAVEIYGVKPNLASPGRTPLLTRLEDLLNDGWVLLVLAIYDRNRYRPGVRPLPNLASVADHVAALAERSSRDESLRGRYRVIGRQGQTMAPGRFKLNHRTVIDGA